VGPGLGVLVRAGGEGAVEGMRSALRVSLGDAFRVGKGTDGVGMDFDGVGKDWGNVVCMAETSLGDFAYEVVESVDEHRAHEEENEEVGCVWDCVAHGVVVISNEVGVVVGEGIEAFGEEKGGDLGLEGVEEASMVLEAGNRVVEVQKVVWGEVEEEGAGIDGALDKLVSILVIRSTEKTLRGRALMHWGYDHNHVVRRANRADALVTITRLGEGRHIKSLQIICVNE